MISKWLIRILLTVGIAAVVISLILFIINSAAKLGA